MIDSATTDLYQYNGSGGARSLPAVGAHIEVMPDKVRVEIRTARRVRITCFLKIPSRSYGRKIVKNDI